jgi:hypothetical protein
MANDRRRDPYKNFNFLVAFGAVIGGVAALGIFRKLFARPERLPPGVYIEEVPAGSRPIEGVGTSTAPFVGTSPKQTKRKPSRARGR